MSIFSRRGQTLPPEDLDQGYDHGYYQQSNRRTDDRRGDDRRGDDRYDERYDDRRGDDRYDERYDERYDDRRGDRQDDRRDDRRGDYYDDRRRTDDRRQDDRRTDDRRDTRNGYEGDEYVARPRRRERDTYEEQDAPGYTERTREDARRRSQPEAPKNKGTLYFAPESCQDGREDMVCQLADSHAIVVDLNALDGKNLTRMLDYLMGAVQALGADIRRVQGQYILLSPAGVEVTDQELDLPPEEAEEEEYIEEEDYVEEEVYDEETEEA